MQGREAGQEGVRRAEDYIGAAFARFGLDSLPGYDRFHVDLTLYADDFDRSATVLRLDAADEVHTGVPGIDFRPFGFSGEGSVEAEVVFVGYGITAPEHEYDDYAGLDAEGKIVLVLRHEPGETDPSSSFDGTAQTNHAQFAVKADPAGDDLRIGGRLRLEPTPGTATANGSSDERFLAVHVTRDMVQRMVEPSGLTLEAMQTGVDAGRRPAEFDTTITWGATRARAIRSSTAPTTTPRERRACWRWPEHSLPATHGRAAASCSSPSPPRKKACSGRGLWSNRV
jgi:hypothetical protein